MCLPFAPPTVSTSLLVQHALSVGTPYLLWPMMHPQPFAYIINMTAARDIGLTSTYCYHHGL